MTMFVALGDSITLGIGDPAPGGTWRGWAALLAESLPEPRLHNLATSGAQAADVERDQLPRALELRPDVASVIVGINDTLRSSFDPVRIARAAEHTVGALCSAGAVVLTIRLPDPGLILGLPAALARPLARRICAVNAVMDDLAERFGTLHFDVAGDPETYDRRMWSVDRLHPSERGHRLIACRFHDMLAGAGLPVASRPDPEPSSPPPTRRAKAGWMATKGTAWVIKRSTDLVPYLLLMGIRELWASADPEPGPGSWADDGAEGADGSAEGADGSAEGADGSAEQTAGTEVSGSLRPQYDQALTAEWFTARVSG
jgi:lysophospholipase L1-like esterase